MRHWSRGEIIGLITLVVAVLACIANWIVVPGLRNIFTNRGFWLYALPFVLVFALLGLIVAFIVWQYSTPHLATSDVIDSNNNTSIEKVPVEPNISAVGTQLIYAGPDKVIIWTTIKLTDRSGKEIYLKNLAADNFTVSESFSGETNQASIIKVTSANIPAKAILVIDQSGSMQGNSGVDNSAKMEIAKNAAIFFFDELTTSDKNYVAVLPFSGNKVENKNFLKNDGGGIWLNKKSKKILESSMNRLKGNGKTPLWQAINLALEQFSGMNDESYKVVICLSDGNDNIGSVSFEMLLSEAREEQIPIFTIGYGGEGDLNSQQLIQLSNDSGAGRENAGSFIRVSPEDWSARLGSIGKGITNLYEVYWHPTSIVSGTRITVQIDINYDLNGEILRTSERRSYVLP